MTTTTFVGKPSHHLLMNISCLLSQLHHHCLIKELVDAHIFTHSLALKIQNQILGKTISMDDIACYGIFPLAILTQLIENIMNVEIPPTPYVLRA